MKRFFTLSPRTDTIGQCSNSDHNDYHIADRLFTGSGDYSNRLEDSILADAGNIIITRLESRRKGTIKLVSEIRNPINGQYIAGIDKPIDQSLLVYCGDIGLESVHVYEDCQ